MRSLNSLVAVLIATVFVFVFATGIGKNMRKINNGIKTPQHAIKNFYSPITKYDETIKCSWLKHLKRPFRLCKNDPGMSEVLLSARHLATSSCEEQFRYNRWNCSRSRKTFKNIYRETALLYALASSAMTFTIARACADSKLISCSCGKEQDYKKTVSSWKQGLCNDNVKFAKHFTKKFLQLKNLGDDQTEIFRHNSEIGISLIVNHVKTRCRCPGHSASCGIKICWKQIEAFEKVALVLKDKYQNALLTEIRNKARVGNIDNREKLLYLAKSPTFCKSTPGRRCINSENCANLCCGRGYNARTVKKSNLCNCKCKENKSCQLECDNCTTVEEQFICK